MRTFNIPLALVIAQATGALAAPTSTPHLDAPTVDPVCLKVLQVFGQSVNVLKEQISFAHYENEGFSNDPAFSYDQKNQLAQAKSHVDKLFDELTTLTRKAPPEGHFVIGLEQQVQVSTLIGLAHELLYKSEKGVPDSRLHSLVLASAKVLRLKPTLFKNCGPPMPKLTQLNTLTA